MIAHRQGKKKGWRASNRGGEMDVDVVLLNLEKGCHLQQWHCSDVLSQRFLHNRFYLPDTTGFLVDQLQQRVGRVRFKSMGSIHDSSGRHFFSWFPLRCMPVFYCRRRRLSIRRNAKNRIDVFVMFPPLYLSATAKVFGAHRSRSTDLPRITELSRHGGR